MNIYQPQVNINMASWIETMGCTHLLKLACLTFGKGGALCQLLLDLFAFRGARVTRAREVQTKATNQWGRTTTEASDQSSDQGLQIDFIDAGRQYKPEGISWTFVALRHRLLSKLILVLVVNAACIGQSSVFFIAAQL